MEWKEWLASPLVVDDYVLSVESIDDLRMFMSEAECVTPFNLRGWKYMIGDWWVRLACMELLSYTFGGISIGVFLGVRNYQRQKGVLIEIWHSSKWIFRRWNTELELLKPGQREWMNEKDFKSFGSVKLFKEYELWR